MSSCHLGPCSEGTAGPHPSNKLILSKVYFFLYYYTDPVFSKLPLYFPEKWAPAPKSLPRALSPKRNNDFIQHYIFFSILFCALTPFTKLPLHLPEKNGPSERLPSGPFFLNPPLTRLELKSLIEGSVAIRGLALENGKIYCPNAKKDWKIKCY